MAGGKRDNAIRFSGKGEFVGTIVRQEDFGGDQQVLVVELRGEGAECLGKAKAGQFVQVACRELGDPRTAMPLLRRPLSLAAVCRQGERTIVELMYRVVGPGTRWLGHRRVGESVNLLGPLGQGFTFEQPKEAQAVLVGGGVGLPPLYLLATQLSQAGYRNVVGFAGARTREGFCGRVDWNLYDAARVLAPQPVLEQFARAGAGTILATDDGSGGFAGFVAAALDRYLDEQAGGPAVWLYACGPYGMLKATAALAQRRQLPCQVCLEAQMACGFGVCQSCAVPVRTAQEGQRDYRLVCTHGPVFAAGMIIWD